MLTTDQITAIIFGTIAGIIALSGIISVRRQTFTLKKEKYQQHSKDLVDALKTWVDSIIFPYCEYVDGSLKVDDYSSTSYDIPLLKQAKDHLDKGTIT